MGDFQQIGMSWRSAFTKPILSRNARKTAIPPKGVTARCVSRKISRSSDKRAVISRGTGLSVAFDSISLLSQILYAFIAIRTSVVRINRVLNFNGITRRKYGRERRIEVVQFAGGG